MRARLAELQALEADLMALRSRCDGSDAQCHIIEALHQRADAQKTMHPLRRGLRLASAMCDAGVMATLPTGQGRRRAMHVSKCFVCFCFDSWQRLMDKRWRPKTFDVIDPA